MSDNFSYVNSKGKTYYLNTKLVKLRGDREYPIYYFSLDVRPEATTLPEGGTVSENSRTGLPFVKRSQKKAA